MAYPEKKHISPDAYFALEETALYKSEYFNGEIFAMSGASFPHNLIVWNISSASYEPLNNAACFAFSGDMRVQVDEARHYTYPDISIVCGDIEFVNGRDDTLANPAVIFEILSHSTKDYDRGSKFTAYRKIPCLRDYVLVDQYACHIEYFHKDETGIWGLNEFEHIEDMLKIRSPDIALPLRKIYHRVQW